MTLHLLKTAWAILAVGVLILIAGCSSAVGEITPTQDTTYLTPIPDATLSAFKRGAFIDNKQDAVIAARLELMSLPHYKPIGPVKTLYAEKSKLPDAYAQVGKSGNYYAPDWLEDTVVWLVVFESDIQVNPPGQRTPNPLIHGCLYVLINAAGGFGGQVGGVDCMKFTGLQSK